MAAFNKGQVIHFSYPGGSDQFRECLVLSPNYRGQTHCINLNYLSDAEIKQLAAFENMIYIMQPLTFYNKYLKGTKGYRKYDTVSMGNIRLIARNLKVYIASLGFLYGKHKKFEQKPMAQPSLSPLKKPLPR